MELLPKVRYVVTKSGKDGTLKEGDIIKLEEDGILICVDEKGWLEPDEIPSAIEGIETKIDVEYYNRMKEHLLVMLERVDEIIDCAHT